MNNNNNFSTTMVITSEAVKYVPPRITGYTSSTCTYQPHLQVIFYTYQPYLQAIR